MDRKIFSYEKLELFASENNHFAGENFISDTRIGIFFPMDDEYRCSRDRKNSLMVFEDSRLKLAQI